MALNLDKLMHAGDFLVEIAPLGSLRVGRITMGGLSDIFERFPESSKESDESFVRFLITLTAHRSIPNSEKYGASVTESEAAEIPLDQLNFFAEEFLRNDTSLFQDFRTAGDRAQFPRGDVDPTDLGKIKFPREKDEDIKHYLRRAIFDCAKRLLEGTRKIFQEMLPRSLLTPTTNSLLASNMALGKSLSDALGNVRINLGDIKNNIGESWRENLGATASNNIARVRESEIPALESMVDSLSEIHTREFHIPENPIHKTNERLELLAKDIGALASVVNSSAGLLGNMNKLAIEMVGTSTKNAEKAHRHSLAALVFAAIGLVVTASFSGLDYFRSKDDEAAQAKSMKEIAGRIAESNAAVIEIQKRVLGNSPRRKSTACRVNMWIPNLSVSSHGCAVILPYTFCVKRV